MVCYITTNILSEEAIVRIFRKLKTIKRNFRAEKYHKLLGYQWMNFAAY